MCVFEILPWWPKFPGCPPPQPLGLQVPPQKVFGALGNAFWCRTGKADHERLVDKTNLKSKRRPSSPPAQRANFSCRCALGPCEGMPIPKISKYLLRRYLDPLNVFGALRYESMDTFGDSGCKDEIRPVGLKATSPGITLRCTSASLKPFQPGFTNPSSTLAPNMTPPCSSPRSLRWDSLAAVPPPRWAAANAQ